MKLFFQILGVVLLFFSYHLNAEENLSKDAVLEIYDFSEMKINDLSTCAGLLMYMNSKQNKINGETIDSRLFRQHFETATDLRSYEDYLHLIYTILGYEISQEYTKNTDNSFSMHAKDFEDINNIIFVFNDLLKYKVDDKQFDFLIHLTSVRCFPLIIEAQNQIIQDSRKAYIPVSEKILKLIEDMEK